MKIFIWIKGACIDFLIINLFLTLISLPILVAWGLPLSWLSPFGNLIFSPFLSLFLLTSTLSFFCELLHLPHALFDGLLEMITHGWYALLQLAPTNSFVGFCAPAFYLLSVLALAAVILLLLPQFRAAYPRVLALSFLFFCSLALLKATHPTHVTTTLSCVKKDLQVMRENNQTLLIDEGAFSERGQPGSWVQYHLMPDLLRATGCLRIDYLLLTRPTIRAFEAAVALLQQTELHTIYFPAIEGEVSGSHRGIFRKLYAISKEKGVKMQRIAKEMVIEMGTQKLHIIPEKKISYRDITYPTLCCTLH